MTNPIVTVFEGNLFTRHEITVSVGEDSDEKVFRTSYRLADDGETIAESFGPFNNFADAVAGINLL